MSMHKIPLTPLEEAGLRAHGLDVGTPSQLSDVFRQGVKWALERGAAVVAHTPCKECGGSSQTWFTQNVITTGVPQNRLNTNDVRCQFVLGCDECSETLKVIGADKVADRLNARSEVPSED